MEMTGSNRSSLARKKVLRRRRTSDRAGSKRQSVTDHTHAHYSSKQVSPVKRAPFRGAVVFIYLNSVQIQMQSLLLLTSLY